MSKRIGSTGRLTEITSIELQEEGHELESRWLSLVKAHDVVNVPLKHEAVGAVGVLSEEWQVVANHRILQAFRAHSVTHSCHFYYI